MLITLPSTRYLVHHTSVLQMAQLGIWYLLTVGFAELYLKYCLIQVLIVHLAKLHLARLLIIFYDKHIPTAVTADHHMFQIIQPLHLPREWEVEQTTRPANWMI